MAMQTQASQVENAGSPSAHEAISITPNAPRPGQKASRKRTKTGCLTCRKRRIKCGEERPVCINCTKSKRDCDGYSQRVIFKPSSGMPHPAGHASGSAGPVPLAPSLTSGLNSSFQYPHTSSPQPWGHLATPKQTYEQSYANSASGLQASATFGQNASYQGHIHHDQHSVAYIHGDNLTMRLGWEAQTEPVHPFDHGRRTVLPRSPSASYDEPSIRLNQNTNPYRQALASQPYQSFQSTHTPTTNHLSSLRSDSYPSMDQEIEHPLSAASAQARNFVPGPTSRQRSFSSDEWQRVSPPSASAPNGKTFTFDDRFDPERDFAVKHIKQEVVFPDDERRRYSVHDFMQQASFGAGNTSASQPASTPIKGLNQDSEDEEDEESDPWDVEMELSQTSDTPAGDPQRELSMMLSRHATQDVARLRTFNTFLDNPNVLATYRPSPSSSPLTDENAARIFCHFVHVTGPCISIFERQATNSSMSFHNSPVPQFPKTLWTYTLPSIALSHPPLMHAILALSSLHIAKLQGTSDAPSIKHFTYALRRVSKLIGLPKRRNEIPTLAANLLVGFYEILLADHSKWNIHLSGARILVMEIDFASMTRRLRRMRGEARERIACTPAFSYEDYIQIAGVPETLLPDKDWEVDERLISQLTGLHVDYDNQWQSRTNMPVPLPDLSGKDVEDYKILQDLHWWYCKQDIFSSMVSGNRLLMPYEHWKYCPPRGQIGKLETTYATMDYLCLIMARLTDFGGKDQLRKRKAVAAQGGQWRPPPNFFGPGNPPAAPPPSKPSASKMAPPDRPASTPARRTPGYDTSGQNRPPSNSAPTRPTALPQPNQSQSRGHAPNTSSGPMYGMMPPPAGPIQMHSAFHAMSANIHDTGDMHSNPSPSPSTPTSSDMDLSAATALALQEHTSISTAFDLFAHLLANAEYAPLTTDTTPPISTPFGPAIQYRTYPISCIWAFYHVGRILLHRLHPYMPPAAMVSAGVCSHLTHTHAQTIGRICAGLYLPSTYSFQTANLNPSLGSALMESSFSLFFAGIQFQDVAQRGWTVSKLNDIARLTGWQTSSAIAAGCEVCWERMGEMGKGPKYVSTIGRGSRDERLDGRTRRGEGSGDGGVGWGGAVKAEGLRRASQKQKVPNTQDEEDDDEEEEPDLLINHDRRFINVNANARVHWALGILGVEDDMRKLDLEKS